MTKTTKLSIIFLTSAVLLFVARIVFYFINLSDNISGWLFSGIYQIICLGVVPFVMYKLMFKKNDVKDFCFDMRISTKLHYSAYLIALALGFLVFFLNSAVSSLWYVFLQALGFTYASGAGTIFSSPEVLVFEIICVCILPAVFEELMHRGVLLGALDNLKSDRLKIAIVAIFFGLVHQNITQFIPTMVGGLVMAILAVKGRSILPGAIIHFMNNFCVTMVSYNAQKGNAMDTLYNKFYAFYGSNIIVLFALSILAVGIAFWLIKKYINVTRKDRIAQEWAPAELHLNVPKANTPPRQFSWQPKQGNPTMPQAPWIKQGNASTKSTQDADGEFYDLFSTGSQKQQNQPKVEPKIETQVYEFVVKINEEIQKQAEPQQAEPKEEILFPEPTMPKSTRALLFDYGFMAITAVITLLTTISSFIWGILR